MQVVTASQMQVQVTGHFVWPITDGVCGCNYTWEHASLGAQSSSFQKHMKSDAECLLRQSCSSNYCIPFEGTLCETTGMKSLADPIPYPLFLKHTSCWENYIFPDLPPPFHPPKRKGGSSEYTTSSHYGLAVAMDSSKS